MSDLREDPTPGPWSHCAEVVAERDRLAAENADLRDACERLTEELAETRRAGVELANSLNGVALRIDEAVSVWEQRT